MLKAVAGGGGKGMRTVADPADLPGALRAARSEAGSAFGDSAVYLERRILAPRHIEVQLLADHHGTVLPFVERECSIQRRHQKVVEESPSLAVSPDLRARLTSAAAAVARAAGYTNAGTIEFLLDTDGSFYFLEMNTRLQVEHPITEQVTGVDLVQWQIRIARGERLTLDAAAHAGAAWSRRGVPHLRGGSGRRFHALAGPGARLRVPQGPGIRDDSGLYEGAEVPIYYDPMISKLVAWGDDRAAALARMQRALAEYEVRGIRTTIPFFRWILEDEDFRAGRFDTTFIDRKLGGRNGPGAGGTRRRARGSRGGGCGRAPVHERGRRGRRHRRRAVTLAVRRRGTARAADAQSGAGDSRVHFDLEIGGRVRRLQVDRRDGRYHVAVDDRSFEVDPRAVGRETLSLLVEEGDGAVKSVEATVMSRPGSAALRSQHRRPRVGGHAGLPFGGRAGEATAGAGPQQVTAPMPGKVVRVLVVPGDAVEPRQGLVVIEAMKMENELRAGRAGRVKAVRVVEGQSVEAGAPLVLVE